jgi:uncharacterized cupredoxin-like copper-binding protein
MAAMAAFAFGLSGCGGSDAPTASSNQAGADTGTPPASATEVTGGKTTVSMKEFSFGPDELSANAGTLAVTAKNDGDSPHEFVLIRTSKAPDGLPMKGSTASEAGAVGEVPEQPPGAAASHSFKLKPGKYVFICNVPGHYAAGMYGSLTVK